ncbi:hypothetical protein M422DRAFT_164361, partial [Sphaerobolus stellatus SS14]
MRHRPGRENKVVDGISRKWVGYQGTCNEGEDYDVDPGRESTHGIINDIFALQAREAQRGITERFAEEPYFLEIIEWLEEGRSGGKDDEQTRKRMLHKARDYMVEEEKLWRVARGRQAWRAPKVECIPGTEAYKIARKAHTNGGHFGRDLTILKLQQMYFWHNMQRTVVEAIV